MKAERVCSVDNGIGICEWCCIEKCILNRTGSDFTMQKRREFTMIF
jgi:hypothetical protein